MSLQPAMSSYSTRNNRTSKRGVFVNGVWHCDCDPWRAAEKFQTKNGGKNHGRWFYKCARPQHKQCPFFLWEDEAKVREQGAVLSNSGSEPASIKAEPTQEPVTAKMTPPRTPQRTVRQTLLQLPTSSKPRANLMSRMGAKTRSPTRTPTKTHGKMRTPDSEAATDEYDWSSGNDEELASALDSFETPTSARIAAPMSPTSSPSKRSYSVMKEESPNDADGSDVFTTPATSSRRLAREARTARTAHTDGGSPFPTPTPTPVPATTAATTSSEARTTLTSQTLDVLKPHNLPEATISSITELLASYELRTAGITRGRDITRLALEQKDEKIAELQASVQQLEHERGMLKKVISVLKSDLAASTATKQSNRRLRGRPVKAQPQPQPQQQRRDKLT